jgi:hypothetical protein
MSGDDDEGREVIDLTAIARDDQLVEALAAGDLRAAEAVAPGDPVLEFLKAQPRRRLVILVTGSRDYSVPERIGEGRRLIGNALSRVVRDALADEVVIRHGGCRGADMIADEWACEMQRLGRHVEIDRRPARWKLYGRRAGYERNAEMNL